MIKSDDFKEKREKFAQMASPTNNKNIEIKLTSLEVNGILSNLHACSCKDSSSAGEYCAIATSGCSVANNVDMGFMISETFLAPRKTSIALYHQT